MCKCKKKKLLSGVDKIVAQEFYSIGSLRVNNILSLLFECKTVLISDLLSQ